MGRPALIVGDGLDVSQSLTPSDLSQYGRWADAGQLSSIGAAVHALVASLPMGDLPQHHLDPRRVS